MRTIKIVISSVVALVMGGACGNANDSTSSDSTTTTDDITTYQQLATEINASATGYRTTMMDPGTTTVADCQRIHGTYDGKVRPWVASMQHMSARMDDYMNHHDGANDADYSCVSASMMYELDHHRAAACASTDSSENQAEAGRHVDAMVSYGGHMFDRCVQMKHGMNTGNWGWAPMMGICADWDGHCNSMMQHDCPGDTMGGRMHTGM